MKPFLANDATWKQMNRELDVNNFACCCVKLQFQEDAMLKPMHLSCQSS